jgi:hypothetical protein
MDMLAGMMDKITTRMSRLLSSDLQSQLSRIMGQWNSGGGSHGVVGSSPGHTSLGASAGLNWPRAAMQWAAGRQSSMSQTKSALAGFRFQRAKKRYRQSRSRMQEIAKNPSATPPWMQQRVQQEHARRQQEFDAAKINLRTAKDDQLHSSPIQRILDKLNGTRPSQKAVDPNAINSSNPADMVKQMLGQLRDKRQSGNANSKWLTARKGPFAQMGRAKALSEKAATRYQGMAKHRDSLKLAYDNARKRHMAAPKIGQAGFDLKRSKSLTAQMDIAKSAFKSADARAAGGLERLAQASNLYATSTNAAAGSMRLVGRLAGPLGIIAAVAGAPAMIEQMGAATVESHRHRGMQSMDLLAAYNTYDQQSMSRQYRQTQDLMPELQQLIASQSQFADNMLPYHTMWERGKLNLANNAANLGNSGVKNAEQAWKDPMRWLASFVSSKAAEDIEKDEEEKDKQREKDSKKLGHAFGNLLMEFSGISDAKKRGIKNMTPRELLPPLK